MARWISALRGSTMSMGTLEDLFMLELKELYDVENKVIDALPRMAEVVSSAELRAALGRHLEVTQRQKDRLIEIFHRLGREPESIVCEGIRGILEDATMIVNARGDSVIKDAALIGAAQQVAHYETASYGTVRTFAQVLGWNDIADIIEETLDEEKLADVELAQVTTACMNQRAARSAPDVV